jgi:hypothetical protein
MTLAGSRQRTATFLLDLLGMQQTIAAAVLQVKFSYSHCSFLSLWRGFKHVAQW